MDELLPGFLGTVRTTNFAVGAKACLIGDAAHAITPFFGQGTNAGFEDCFVLSSLLDTFASQPLQPQFAMAFAAFSAKQVCPPSLMCSLPRLQNFVAHAGLFISTPVAAVLPCPCVCSNRTLGQLPLWHLKISWKCVIQWAIPSFC